MTFYEDKIFSFLLDTLTIGLRQQCQEVMQTTSGRVLEIGIGTGANLSFHQKALANFYLWHTIP